MRIILVVFLLSIAACAEPTPEPETESVGWTVSADMAIPTPTPTVTPTPPPTPTITWSVAATAAAETRPVLIGDDDAIIELFRDTNALFEHWSGTPVQGPAGQRTTIYHGLSIMRMHANTRDGIHAAFIRVYGLSGESVQTLRTFLSALLPEWKDPDGWVLDHLADGTTPAGIRFGGNVAVTLEVQLTSFLVTVEIDR